MPATIRTPSLNALLALDAATCAAMGALLTLASGPLAELTSIPEAVVFRAGALLLPVTAFMAFGARAWPVPGWMAGAVIAGNALWAAASVLLPASGLDRAQRHRVGLPAGAGRRRRAARRPGAGGNAQPAGRGRLTGRKEQRT